MVPVIVQWKLMVSSMGSTGPWTCVCVQLDMYLFFVLNLLYMILNMVIFIIAIAHAHWITA